MLQPRQTAIGDKSSSTPPTHAGSPSTVNNGNAMTNAYVQMVGRMAYV